MHRIPNVRVTARSDDTHIRSCGMMDRCIDARVRLGWDVDYYVKHHMVGGFFNDAHGTGKPINSQYVTTEMRCEIPSFPLLLPLSGRGTAPYWSPDHLPASPILAAKA